MTDLARPASTDALANAKELAYVALRIVAGVLMAFHGLQKVAGVFADPSHMPPVFSQLWIGGAVELVGGSLVALGLFTRITAFILSGQMAVAYIQFHWKLQFDHGMFLPAVNQGELAVVYAFVYLYFAFAGGGRASLDRAIRQIA